MPMNATHPQAESSDRNYQQALSAYVERGGEALLARAYDFGREALAQGRSIPELVGLHSQALRAIVAAADRRRDSASLDRKSTRLNSSHGYISYAVFCLKKKTKSKTIASSIRPRNRYPSAPHSS